LTNLITLTVAFGSVEVAFSNTVGAATLTDNQVYGPYGNLLYSANGTMGTARGYTGQYSDPLTGLDYSVSRYYDPVAGVFLSADTKEGNAQGMNPYAYVAQNPETLNDPSGQMIDCGPGCGNGPPPPPPPTHGPVPCTWQGCQDGNSGSSGNSGNPEQVKMSACNIECQNEEHAQQLAKNAATFYRFLANTLTDLENWISLDTEFGWDKQLELLITYAEGGVASLADPTLAGFIAALPSLASMAQDLANGFAAEANHPLKWFTVQNVENDWGNVLEPSMLDGFKGVGGGVGTAAVGAAVIAFSDGVTAGFVAKVAQAGLTSAEIVAVGAAAMNIIGMGYLQEEVDDLAPPTSIREFR
jgi:RHS repeat-associated protein